MELTRLVGALEDPAAYPHTADGFRVHHTHISVVFLAGRWAYKIKKPLDLDFLDFSTLERREHFCRQEVELNRRRAPGVYRGVVPVTRGHWAEGGEEPVPPEAAPEGALRFGGPGEAVEWAVRMERLPPDATLLERLRRDELDAKTLGYVGRRVAGFHREAEGGEEIARYGRLDVVGGNARENLEQTREHVGRTVSPAVHQRVAERLERRIDELGPRIEARAEEGRPRDTHGDLHLDHLYLFPRQAPPRDLMAVDCIEFNERFRYADPVADMAFLSMDLLFRGRPDLEAAFSDAYFRAADDPEGRELLPFYRSYRAAVRAKVEGVMVLEEEVPEEERRRAAAQARAHWLLALSELECPDRRPGLVVVAGLPGTGKSTVAGGLAESAGFTVVSTDRVRKELAGVGPDTSMRAPYGEGIYGAEWTERTYGRCLERVREALAEGGRVVVDGSFRSERQRARFLDAARDLGVPRLLLVCGTPPEVVRRRLELRAGGKGGEASAASDADWAIYREAAREWEPLAPQTRRLAVEVDTSGTPEAVRAEVLGRLRAARLAEGEGSRTGSAAGSEA